ncbi:tripartite-type tricarboxylate transporter receptor subunit TctC [Comamonas sp. BIGb0152]|uniref:tripartite tricarboxylate transporter substrate binding protein n=1 Tax=Comamonas sp. BIGb0152 TaxID=2940601 RepID=UPI0021671DD6|nr:tripartite tricarboxylate transporter substrate binding protein [Comamonas sp. BIGb0152]MCS4294934.1 tripartite-type tricarboxylate transporter receptor subunit TctC [Comamonas sp. BIGb0152]
MQTLSPIAHAARTLLACSLVVNAAAHAQPAADGYPNKPVKVIVPFSAGGVVDSVARIISDRLSSQYGKPFIVENKTGAGGSIGTDYVAKSAPDGYTLLAVSPSHAVAPALQKSLTWDPVRDFKAIAGFGYVPNIIVVHPSLPAKTMAEFIALAKKSDPSLTYATAGLGTSNHLSGELLAQEAKISLAHVPYKGQSEALNDLLSGRVNMMPLTSALAIPHVKSGKLRALAVTTAKRSSASPDLPTVAESAQLPNYNVGTWFGFVAPSKTPAPVLQKLSADIDKILAQPEVRTKLESLGMEMAPQNAQQFDSFIAQERDKWRAVIQQAGIEPN